jgi:hypothetical protein
LWMQNFMDGSSSRFSGDLAQAAIA